MKIVYIIHGLYNSGGMEKILSEKANVFVSEFGDEVTIITSEKKGRKPFFPLDSRVKVVDLGVNYHLPRFHRLLRKTLLELRPDITVSLCGGEMQKLHEIHDGSAKVAELHFSHKRYFFRRGKGPLHNLVARSKTRALEHAAARMDAFVVLTERDRETWVSLVPKLYQIYNFVEIPQGEPSSLNSKHCISVGRLIPSKNFGEMIQAWQLVARVHPDWVLDIYGRGSMKKKLLRQIERLGLEGKVLIHDPVSDVWSRLRESSCFIFTSLNEGMGIALIEAAGAGLPAVSYDIDCGPSEIIEDGVSGYLVRPHDIRDLARKICVLIENEELRRSMGAAALDSCGRFSKEAVIEKWRELFKKLL